MSFETWQRFVKDTIGADRVEKTKGQKRTKDNAGGQASKDKQVRKPK